MVANDFPCTPHSESYRDKKFKFKYNENIMQELFHIFGDYDSVGFITFATFDQLLTYYELRDEHGVYHISANDFFDLTMGQIQSEERDIVLNDYMYYFGIALEYYNNYIQI